MRRRPNVCLLLGQRRTQLATRKPTLSRCLLGMETKKFQFVVTNDLISSLCFILNSYVIGLGILYTVYSTLSAPGSTLDVKICGLKSIPAMKGLPSKQSLLLSLSLYGIVIAICDAHGHIGIRTVVFVIQCWYFWWCALGNTYYAYWRMQSYNMLSFQNRDCEYVTFGASSGTSICREVMLPASDYVHCSRANTFSCACNLRYNAKSMGSTCPSPDWNVALPMPDYEWSSICYVMLQLWE